MSSEARIPIAAATRIDKAAEAAIRALSKIAVGFLRCFEEQLDWSFDDIPEGAHMYRAEILKLYNATITTTA